MDRVDIFTSILTVASGIFLLYSAYYRPLIDYQRGIDRLLRYYKGEKRDLNRKIEERRRAIEEKSRTLNSTPDILKALNDTCKGSRVVIDKVVPVDGNPFKFDYTS